MNQPLLTARVVMRYSCLYVCNTAQSVIFKPFKNYYSVAVHLLRLFRAPILTPPRFQLTSHFENLGYAIVGVALATSYATEYIVALRVGDGDGDGGGGAKAVSIRVWGGYWNAQQMQDNISFFPPLRFAYLSTSEAIDFFHFPLGDIHGCPETACGGKCCAIS